MVTGELAAFLSGQIDIHIGTRDANLRPNSARASAVRVEDDGEHVVAFVPALGADAVLRDLDSNGQAALFVGRPPDNLAYQLKGTLMDARPAAADERAYIEQFWASFLEAMAVIGFDRAIFAHWPVWPSVAIRMRVTAVFRQTPGPGTGAPVA